MRLCIESIALEDTSRRVTFEPGLNIITGPMASGKTTLFRFIRALLGGPLNNLPLEARDVVSAILGEIVIGNTKYSIFRPVVTTSTARVEVASKNLALRLPVSELEQESNQTYLQWLLDRLNLPHLEVPSAPTRPESEPTPVSLNDYLLYCVIPQEEIGFAVFGHTHPFKNIKRKYVFEILYGIYNIEMARIQEELRDVQTKLRELKNQDKLFSRFLEDTVLDNRAEIELNLRNAQIELNEIENDVSKNHTASRSSSLIEKLQGQVLTIESNLQHLQAELDSEQYAVENLRRLSAQLEIQIGKITRSIVAQKYLADIDFVVCPRCGTNVVQNRGDRDICYLCLQELKPTIPRVALIEEQSRIEAQLSEARDLLTARQQRKELLSKEFASKQREASRIREELDFQTNTFISSQAGRITELATKRAEIKSRVSQLTEYLQIFRKFDEVRKWAKELDDRKKELEQQLDSSMGNEAEIHQRIEHLNYQFNNILERFHPPELGEEKRSAVDNRTYLPQYHGRRFDDISSPGLATLVTLAYALAHQYTSIDLNLILPSILLIDGLSEHLGTEGLDPARLEAVYSYLIEVSEKIGDTLQIIAVDNEVPSIARRYVRIELSDTDRLIPPKN
jgi:hypothetical protein